LCAAALNPLYLLKLTKALLYLACRTAVKRARLTRD
jgi:hypothetical protein